MAFAGRRGKGSLTLFAYRSAMRALGAILKERLDLLLIGAGVAALMWAFVGLISFH